MPSKLAFPKARRLRLGHEFRRTMDGGVKTVCPLVVLFAATPETCEKTSSEKTSKTSDGPRLGLVVSRKVGNAVVRNRVKRQLREAFRHLIPELAASPVLGAIDLVVVARAEAAAATGNDLKESLSRCLARLARQLGAKAR